MDDTQSIANLFQGLGIKGDRGEACKCPIAEYVLRYWNDNFGPWQDIQVGVSPWSIRVSFVSGTDYRIELPLPDGSSLQRFIGEFDTGKFPLLER